MWEIHVLKIERAFYKRCRLEFKFSYRGMLKAKLVWRPAGQKAWKEWIMLVPKSKSILRFSGVWPPVALFLPQWAVLATQASLKYLKLV